MSLREWLIAIGTLVIIVIVVDGIRRMHRARKESMAISSGMGADELKESPLDDEYNPELPNGGARIVTRGNLDERGDRTRDTAEPDSDDAVVDPDTGSGAIDDDREEPVQTRVQSRPEQPRECAAAEAA